MLTMLQRDNSMLTFESASVAGTAGIVEKLSVGSGLVNIWDRVANFPLLVIAIREGEAPGFNSRCPTIWRHWRNSDFGHRRTLGMFKILISLLPGGDYTATRANASFVQVDEEQRAMNYSQTFQLLPDGQGSYFIFNDIFKLVFG